MLDNKNVERKLNTKTTDFIKSTWWVLLLASILLTVIGVYALFFPGATLELFAIFTGAILITSGIFGFIKSLSTSKTTSVAGIILSIVSFIIGIYILIYPVVFIEVLLFLFAIALLAKSIVDIQISTNMSGSSKGWLIFSGIIGIIAAVFLFISPTISGIAILLILGVYAILLGVLSIIDLCSVRSKVKKALKK
jgi:uncharacterized membrane protein HdeD (DUF308 family)